MRALQRILLLSALVMVGDRAWAHHSFAMFDLKKELTLKGSVKEFQWTNPHVWIQLLVTDEKGITTEWSLEMGAPGMLVRTGWKSSTLKANETVTVVIHPVKSGKPSGSLVKVTLPDGRVLGPGGPPPRPPSSNAAS